MKGEESMFHNYLKGDNSHFMNYCIVRLLVIYFQYCRE